MATIEAAGRTVEYAQSGEGPDVLLLHPLLADMTAYERVVQDLRRSRRVTSINLPGFGASAPAPYVNIAEYAEHVTKVMDALELSNSTDVFGNDFGAFLGMQMAIKHGARFNRLIVADVVASLPDSEKSALRDLAALAKDKEKGMHAVVDACAGRMFSVGFEAAHPEVVKERKSWLGNKVNGEAFAQACVALAELDLAPALEKVGTTTLVLCGELNLITPPDRAKELALAIKDAVYFPIKDSGQLPMLEQPQTLAALIEEFLLIKRGSG